MSKFWEKVKEEVWKLIPPTLFFMLTLSLVSLVRWLMLKGTGIPLSTPLQIFVAALILGKAVLIADMLPVINRFPKKPLVWNVVWKTLIYVAVSMGIHYLERLVDFWKEAGSFAGANKLLLEKIIWPHFWAIQIVLTLLIFTYCMFHEFVRVLGRDRVQQMFFRTQETRPESE